MKATRRPGIVHRLDKETSGILVLAKNDKAMKLTQKLFKNRLVKKTYLALVKGQMRFRNGTIDLPLMRSRRDRKKIMVSLDDTDDTAREAITDYSVIWETGQASLVKLSPRTGRTHQLRVHLAHLGNPILGDGKYGQKTSFFRLALHASDLEFEHPISRLVIHAHAPLPALFTQFIREKGIMERQGGEKI
jgi:23S rRNA pseudouridine1911/1915/1917 synthase